MRLTPRLMKIAGFVERGSVVADVGTDHGYIPAYLLENGIIERAILSDINKGPLENAETTIRGMGLLANVDLRLASGLDALKPDEADTVIIAGMGGELIAQILDKGRETAKACDRLILQPMQQKDALREYLYENNYAVIEEALEVEGERLYEIIICKYLNTESEDEVLKERLEEMGRIISQGNLFREIGFFLKDDELFSVLVDKRLNALRLLADRIKGIESQEGRYRETMGLIEALERAAGR